MYSNINTPFSNIPFSWLTIPKCPECGLEFKIFTKSCLERVKPCLLPCSHLLCNKCIKNGNGKCFICGNNILRERFENHFFIVGLINFLNYKSVKITPFGSKETEFDNLKTNVNLRQPRENMLLSSIDNTKESQHFAFDANSQKSNEVNKTLQLLQTEQSEHKTFKKILQLNLKKIDKYAKESVEKITNEYIELTGILQNLMQQNLQDIQKFHTSLKDETTNIIDKLSKTEVAFENILNEFDELTNCDDINNLIKLLKCKNINIDVYNNNPIDINIDSQIIRELETAVKLHLNRNLLVKQFTYLDDNLLKMFFNKNKKQTNTVQPNKNKSNELNMSGSFESFYQSKLVKVTHIESPVKFYVQDALFNFDSLIKLIQRDAKINSIPELINIGERYLVSNSQDIFNRCEVNKIIDNNCYQVLLIDYGYFEIFGKNKFRSISKDLLSVPDAVIKCSIHNIQPEDNGQWDSLAKRIMLEIISNQHVTMVLYEHGMVNLVDLISNSNGYSTSIRDALIYMKKARVLKTSKIVTRNIKKFNEFLKNIYFNENEKKSYNNNIQKSKSSINVNITHIVSPNKFYCRKKEYEDLTRTMCSDLNLFYQNTKLRIYLPQVGMLCAVYHNKSWHRGKISTLHEGQMCELELLEIGIQVIVSWEYLRILDQMFSSLESVFCCSLKDVSPLKQDNYEWSCEAINEFKKYNKKSNNKNLSIFIDSYDVISEKHHIFLYIQTSSSHECINTLLVESNFAMYTGIINIEEHDIKLLKNTVEKESNNLESDDKIKETTTISKLNRETIKILNIISPNEFFVSIEKLQKRYNKMHLKIQNIMKVKSFNECIWKENDYCVIKKVTVDNDLLWYRGTILDINNGNYTVFLRDLGIIMKVNVDSLYCLPECDKYMDFAVKCNLSNIKPTSGLEKWPCITIDEFKDIINNYEQLSMSLISMVGISCGVILWGLSIKCNTDPLAGTLYEWQNINLKLVDLGLVHLTEKYNFNPEKENDDFYFNLESFISDSTVEKSDVIIEEVIINNEIGSENPVVSWLPSQPINKSLFTAIPTFVDKNIIYLYDATQKEQLDNMNKSINLKYANTNAIDYIWNSDQPCIVKYNPDNCFYRGIVINNLGDKLINVRFIDYGNFEQCELIDLRKAFHFGDIPIFASQYTLDNVNISQIYNRRKTDFIHKHIVDKLCFIRVDTSIDLNSTIIPCSITIDGIDLTDLLQANGFIMRIDQKPNKEPQKKNKNLSVSSSSQSSGQIKTKKNETITISSGNLEVENKLSHLNISCDKIDKTTVDSDISFHLAEIDASSFHSDYYKHEFPQINIKEREFYCYVSNISNDLNIYICPDIENHTQNIKNMISLLQIAAKQSKPIVQIKKNMFCLAKYTDDQWYRGIIKSYNNNMDEVEVKYIDYLNYENLKLYDVKQFPLNLLEYPLRNMQVELNGLRPNRRMRSSDIKIELCSLLKDDKKIYLKIMSEGAIPKVELYTKSDCETLVYQNMIDTNFFDIL